MGEALVDVCRFLKLLLTGRREYNGWRITVSRNGRDEVYVVLEKNRVRYRYRLDEILKKCVQNIQIGAKKMAELYIPESVYHKLNVSPEFLRIRAYRDEDGITLVMSVGHSMYFIDMDDRRFEEFKEDPLKIIEEEGLTDVVEAVQGIGVVDLGRESGAVEDIDFSRGVEYIRQMIMGLG